jgi:hypothetical protein
MNFLISLIFIIIAQTLAYFQFQSQFFWQWAKDHPILMSLIGVPSSLLFFYFAKYNALHFDGQVWPGRIISFSIGILVFAILSNLVLNEPISLKTWTCIGLSTLIVFIQVFWK